MYNELIQKAPESTVKLLKTAIAIFKKLESLFIVCPKSKENKNSTNNITLERFDKAVVSLFLASLIAKTKVKTILNKNDITFDKTLKYFRWNFEEENILLSLSEVNELMPEEEEYYFYKIFSEVISTTTHIAGLKTDEESMYAEKLILALASYTKQLPHPVLISKSDVQLPQPSKSDKPQNVLQWLFDDLGITKGKSCLETLLLKEIEQSLIKKESKFKKTTEEIKIQTPEDILKLDNLTAEELARLLESYKALRNKTMVIDVEKFTNPDTIYEGIIRSIPGLESQYECKLGLNYHSIIELAYFITRIVDKEYRIEMPKISTIRLARRITNNIFTLAKADGRNEANYVDIIKAIQIEEEIKEEHRRVFAREAFDYFYQEDRKRTL